ncbi:hypothetical protein LLEC1_07535 [Akanthomyces lecanii]|uniref:Uncharacterized protein n=1 Tax=Cordyceps confragosa TaxID=2714763 RepID=A0A179IKW6_CORDF|nr:hypothetical protein LLEC1_07535 [Akanthomyces lecanii]
MSAVGSKLIQELKKESLGPRDFAKLIDCIWRVVSSDDHCRTELRKKVQSARDAPSSVSGDDSRRRKTAERASVATQAARPAARRKPLSHNSTDTSKIHQHGLAVKGVSSQGKRPRIVPTSMSAESSGAATRSAVTKNKAQTSSATSASAGCAGLSARLSKKQVQPAKVLYAERYSKVPEQLRQEVSEYSILQGLQDAWRMVDAFRCHIAGEVRIDPHKPRIEELQRRIDYCDDLERRGCSLSVRAFIERRFHMVNVMAEYRKAVEAKGKGSRCDNIAETFQAILFPNKDARERRTSWDYFRRVANRLFEAVARYGYGVLVFPLRNATCKSLDNLEGEYIGDFLDYLELCHPGLESMLYNLSCVMPKLLTWGLPEPALPILDLPYANLVDWKDRPFHHLFSLPIIESVTTLGEISPWLLPETDEDAEGDLVLPDEETSTAFQFGAVVGPGSVSSNVSSSSAPADDETGVGGLCQSDARGSGLLPQYEIEDELFSGLTDGSS